MALPPWPVYQRQFVVFHDTCMALAYEKKEKNYAIIRIGSLPFIIINRTMVSIFWNTKSTECLSFSSSFFCLYLVVFFLRWGWRDVFFFFCSCQNLLLHLNNKIYKKIRRPVPTPCSFFLKKSFFFQFSQGFVTNVLLETTWQQQLVLTLVWKTSVVGWWAALPIWKMVSQFTLLKLYNMVCSSS